MMNVLSPMLQPSVKGMYVRGVKYGSSAAQGNTTVILDAMLRSEALCHFTNAQLHN